MSQETPAITKRGAVGAAVSGVEAGSDFQIPSSLSATSGATDHTGSGRPENSRGPAIHPRELSADFDVAMHDNHERAKICVRSTVGRTRVVDDIPAIRP